MSRADATFFSLDFYCLRVSVLLDKGITGKCQQKSTSHARRSVDIARGRLGLVLHVAGR